MTPGYYPVIGGVERHVEALSERLVARGHDVTVATMQPRGERLAGETYRGVDIRRFDSRGVGDAYRVPLALPGFLRAGRNLWDVVHVHNYHAGLIPLVALAKVHPFVVTTHLNDVPHSAIAGLLHVPYSRIGRWAVAKADTVICVTEAERRRVVERLGVPVERIVVIPNGVNEALVAAGNDAGERDTHLLLSVGRLQPYKRVEDAISIVAELGAPYRLAVVGDGPQREALEQQAAALGVAGRVTFAGKASDDELVGWYRRAGIVLSLSEAEAFGMTVLEGVAAGAQVVASDIPAFRDLAGQFPMCVTVVPRRDPAAGAEAVRVIGRRAQVTPVDVSAFTWDAVTERVLDVYRRVTGIVDESVNAGGQDPTGAEKEQLADAHLVDAHLADAQGEHLLAEG